MMCTISDDMMRKSLHLRTYPTSTHPPPLHTTHSFAMKWRKYIVFVLRIASLLWKGGVCCPPHNLQHWVGGCRNKDRGSQYCLLWKGGVCCPNDNLQHWEAAKTKTGAPNIATKSQQHSRN